MKTRDAIGAETTTWLMERGLAHNATRTLRTLVLGKAWFHRIKRVNEWLTTKMRVIALQVMALMVPSPDAPNLNSVERSWGTTHREVAHNRHDQAFGNFLAAFENVFTMSLPTIWHQRQDKISDTVPVINPAKSPVTT